MQIGVHVTMQRGARHRRTILPVLLLVAQSANATIELQKLIIVLVSIASSRYNEGPTVEDTFFQIVKPTRTYVA